MLPADAVRPGYARRSECRSAPAEGGPSLTMELALRVVVLFDPAFAAVGLHPDRVILRPTASLRFWPPPRTVFGTKGSRVCFGADGAHAPTPADPADRGPALCGAW